MKKLFFQLAIILTAVSTLSASTIISGKQFPVKQGNAITMSKLAQMNIQQIQSKGGEFKYVHSPYESEQYQEKFQKSLMNYYEQSNDKKKIPVYGDKMLSNLESPSPMNSFPSLSFTGWIPPDVAGAANENYLMTTLNGGVMIQDREGSVLSFVDLDVFWAGMFTSYTFDPKILYDEAAKRWIFICPVDAGSSSSATCIAVSATSDPKGNWYRYKVPADPNGGFWADFPSVGFNKNWIAVTYNMFGIMGGYYGAEIYVFDKQQAYNNNFILTSFNAPYGFTVQPAVTFDQNQDTLYCVETWDYNLYGVSTITGTPPAPQFSHIVHEIPTPYITQFSWDDNVLPQFLTDCDLDQGDSRVNNAIYRNGSLWFSNQIIPANGLLRTSAHWEQLNPFDGNVIQEGLIDDQTATYMYAYPSIAVNKNNDVMIGCGYFSKLNFPGAVYAFRRAADPAGTLRNMKTLVYGSMNYCLTGGGDNRVRWGDYSSCVVDPKNDLDFWTLQEYTIPLQWGQQTIGGWSTYWGQVPGVPDISITLANMDNCPGSQQQMNPVVTGGSGSYTYSWYPPNFVSNPNIANPMTNVSHSTTLTLKVKDNNYNMEMQKSISVNISEPANFIMPLVAMSSKNTAINLNSYINSVTGTSPFTMMWQNESGNKIADPTNVIPPIGITKYFVSVMDGKGCMTPLKRLLVYVSPLKEITGNDNFMAGINGTGALVIYPNPADEFITLYGELESAGDLTINIHDISGKLMLTTSINNVSQIEQKLNLSGFTAGSYVISVESADDKFTGSFIVK